MPKKKKRKKQSHTLFQTHQFAHKKKKKKKELSKKNATIKQNPDEKIKESSRNLKLVSLSLSQENV